jgi:hypothetical protein
LRAGKAAPETPLSAAHPEDGRETSDLANIHFNFARSKHAIFDTLDALAGMDLATAGARIDDPDVRHAEGQVFMDFCANVKGSIIGRQNFSA